MLSPKTLRQYERNNPHYIGSGAAPADHPVLTSSVIRDELQGTTRAAPSQEEPTTPGGSFLEQLVFYLQHPVKCPFILLPDMSMLRVCSCQHYGVLHNRPARQLHTHPRPAAPAAPPGHSCHADPCTSHFSSEV